MIERVKKAIKAKLISSGVNDGVRIWADLAPSGEVYPYVVYNMVSSLLLGNDGSDVYNDLWQVVVYSENDAETREVAGEISSALHRTELTIDNGAGLWSIINSQISDVELEDDTRIYRMGYVFRMFNQDLFN